MKLQWTETCAGCENLVKPHLSEPAHCAINARHVVWDADDGWVPGGKDWSCDRWDDGQPERSEQQ